MGERKGLHLAVGTLVLITAFSAVALSIPQEGPEAAPRPMVTPTAPEGNRPVAPGSYTSIPDRATQPAAPQRISEPVASTGYKPVAPGAYTSIPGTSTPGGTVNQPTAPDGNRPVAPGSYTSIPDSD